MKSHWITHRGQRIFFSDYSGFGEDSAGVCAEINSADTLIAAEPSQTVLLLVDVRDSAATASSIDALKKSATKVKTAVRRMAVVGVTGVRKIFFVAVVNLTGTNMQAFDTLDAAKDWLIS